MQTRIMSTWGNHFLDPEMTDTAALDFLVCPQILVPVEQCPGFLVTLLEYRADLIGKPFRGGIFQR